jgi:hypothetical protein
VSHRRAISRGFDDVDDGKLPGLVYACLTHVPLWLEFPPYVTVIHLGEAQGPGRLNLRDLAPEWVPHHPVLGGTAGAFALKNHLLQHHPHAARIGICQYRKFVSRQRINRAPAPKYRSMDLVPKELLGRAAFAAAMHPGDQEFLVSGPFSFGQHWKRARRETYLEQYVKFHHVDDLLRFTAVAVELGALDKTDVSPFFEEHCFIPGGVELGVFPAPFWIAAITALENIVRECVRRYPEVRPGYQARSWAFCTERLGSYLLMKRFGALGQQRMRFRRFARLFPPEWVTRHTGQLNLIIEGKTADYVLGG